MPARINNGGPKTGAFMPGQAYLHAEFVDGSGVSRGGGGGAFVCKQRKNPAARFRGKGQCHLRVLWLPSPHPQSPPFRGGRRQTSDLGPF